MKKELTAKLLIFALLFMLLPPVFPVNLSAATTFELDENNSDPQNLFYKLDNDELTAEVYIPENIKSGFALVSITIPDSVKKGDNFYTIDRIRSQAFSGLKNVKSIAVPSSVTYIGNYAFDGCESLESLTLPDSLTEIGKNAFYNCRSLKTIAIPNSTGKIGKNAFTYCNGLTEFTVGAGNTAFSSADGVLFNKDKTVLLQYPASKSNTSYNVPNGVKTINESAFRDATALSSISIPASVANIGRYAFDNTAWLNNKPDGIVYLGHAIYTYKGTMTADTDLVLPDNITCIAEYAFYKCKKLLTVTIPQSVTSIGYGAFLYCDKLTAIHVSSSNNYYTSLNGVLFDKNKTTLIQYPLGSTNTEYSVPAGVKSIGGKAFYYCSVLQKIRLPDSLTSIGVNAFEGCTGITEMIIPESATTIDSYAFYYCTGLKSVTIPMSVTEIGDEVFYQCDYVTLNIYKDSFAYEYAVTNNLKYKLFADYEVTFENGFVTGIFEKQTAAKIKKKLSSSDIIKDTTGKVVSADTIVGTGFIITHNNIDFYVVIKGDISGDGLLDSLDYMMLKKIILGNLNVSKVQMKATCISDTTQPDSFDAFLLKKHILGNYNLFVEQ
jgi:hypothetical protein